MKPNFQLILIIIFIAAAIVGILVFSGAIPLGGSKEGSQGTVVMWGTVPAASFVGALEEFNDANPSFVVKYEEKSPASFDVELLEALASGTGPDMFFLTNDLVYHYANKIYPIPYASFPISTFKTTYAGAGEVFLSGSGVMAFPMTIDPLVMYYNRSLLDAEGIVYPPKNWEELVELVPKLTKKDDANKISQSTVALGHSSNVRHYKDILAALFMQAGNPIVREEAGKFETTLGDAVGNYNVPSILEFYTSFADPNHPAYSWNKSFPSSDNAFSSEDLAFYFGFASEFQSFVNRNPNQNFFVAPLPQIKGSKTEVTDARVTGLAISRFSKNFNTAVTAASLLASSDFALKFAAAENLAPARRDYLALKPEDAFSPIFYDSALIAKAWIDPSPKDTDSIWAGMINSVLSNAMSVDNAVKDASAKLRLLLLK